VIKAELGWPTGDQPGDLNFQYPVSGDVQDAILRVLSPSFPLAKSGTLRALAPVENITGRYRLTTPDGSWFVRVSMWLGDAALEKSLVDHLASHKVSVNPLLVAGITLTWAGQRYRVDVRPLITGRHFNGSPEDIRSLVSVTSASHKALLSFPKSDVIRRAAVARYNRFSEVQDILAVVVDRDDFTLFAEHGDWAVQHRNWLAEMAEQFTPHFDRYPGAQCLHGQIHPGNVLFTEDGDAILVDFEESVYTFAPPAFDLGYLVQRFCLRDNPTPQVASQRLDHIRKYYGPMPTLADMMRQLAWYSMASIIEFRVYQGISVPASEYDKFVRLERQARALIGVL